MEPLFLAVICGCNAGFFREALHEVYIPRIQRGDSSFAAKVLGARGALLAVLSHFFDRGRWGSLAPAIVEGRKLSSEDQVYLLAQAARYLTATKDWSSEARTCCERIESLCQSLSRPRSLYVALAGKWLYALAAEPLPAAMKIARRIYSLAEEQGDAALMMGANRALGDTLFFMGDFKKALRYANRGVQLWRSGVVQSPVEEVDAPVVTCLTTQALCEWHFGEMSASRATIAEAISLAKQLNDMQALALALYTAGILAHLGDNPKEVERFALNVIELSTRSNFATWLPLAAVHRGWADAFFGRCSSRLLTNRGGNKRLSRKRINAGSTVYAGIKSRGFTFRRSHRRSACSSTAGGSRNREIRGPLVVFRIAPASRCLSGCFRRQSETDRRFIPRGHQNRKSAGVHLVCRACSEKL